MTRDEVLSLFREAGAILEGHFILTSGLRSPVFLQKARVFMYPDKTEAAVQGTGRQDPVGRSWARSTTSFPPPSAASFPAMKRRGISAFPPCGWSAKTAEFRLRRFDLPKGARVIIVEDIVTTGLSSRETVTSLKALGAEVLAVACLIDRSGGEADVSSVPSGRACGIQVPAYEADKLPPELAALPAVKPGSRGLS